MQALYVPWIQFKIGVFTNIYNYKLLIRYMISAICKWWSNSSLYILRRRHKFELNFRFAASSNNLSVLTKYEYFTISLCKY